MNKDMMNIDDILDTMDDLLDKALGVPLSGGKCLINIEDMRNLIGDVRLNLPGEIKQAKLIVADRKIILSDAKRESEAIVKKSEEKAKHLMDEQEVLKQATAKASEIITDAQSKSRELRNATNEYVDKILSEMEQLLIKNMNDVKRTRNVVKQAR